MIGMDIRRKIRRLSEERGTMLLVVAVLLVRISFQAVLTPPRGVWKDYGKCNTIKVGRGSSDDPVKNMLVCEHKAGTAIALEDPNFWLFLIFNSLIFGISNSLMVLVAPGEYIKLLFFVLNLTLGFNYFYSVRLITDNKLFASCLACISAVFSVLAVKN